MGAARRGALVLPRRPSVPARPRSCGGSLHTTLPLPLLSLSFHCLCLSSLQPTIRLLPPLLPPRTAPPPSHPCPRLFAAARHPARRPPYCLLSLALLSQRMLPSPLWLPAVPSTGNRELSTFPALVTRLAPPSLYPPQPPCNKSMLGGGDRRLKTLGTAEHREASTKRERPQQAERCRTAGAARWGQKCEATLCPHCHIRCRPHQQTLCTSLFSQATAAEQELSGNQRAS